MQNYIIPVSTYFTDLQQTICNELLRLDPNITYQEDKWNSSLTKIGNTRIFDNGTIFERAAVNFSHVAGDKLPPSASNRHPQIIGAPFEALGVSLIIHPLNPHAPTTHANLRMFISRPVGHPPVWWFGGGYDLTPYYGYESDCYHWHQTAYNACAPFGEEVYPEFKTWCDQYFYLKHRQESRGIGGLFFDDLNRWDFDTCFALVKSIGNSFLPAYLPIVKARHKKTYSEQERDFQLYRRGRYVEFNLVYDRGTLFGLQSNGRTESILASLPPQVKWRYNWQPQPNTPEAKLYSDFLQPRDWLKITIPENALAEQV